MSYFSRLIVFASIESFATALVQRGVFFYTRETLAFGETQNLLLALGMGIVYVVGAFPSHRVSGWFGEKRVLLGLLILTFNRRKSAVKGYGTPCDQAHADGKGEG